MVCKESKKWVEEQVEKPITRWVERTENRCKKRKWYDPRRWLCWLVTTLVKVVTFIVVTVGKWVFYVVCETVNAIMNFVIKHVKEVLKFAIFIGLTVALLITQSAPIVPLAVIIAVAIIWGLLALFLYKHRDTWGKEGKYLDWWSVVHLGAGVLLGLLCLPLVWVVLLLILWEVVEFIDKIEETLTNRIADVLLGLFGWFLIKLLVAGTFPILDNMRNLIVD